MQVYSPIFDYRRSPDAVKCRPRFRDVRNVNRAGESEIEIAVPCPAKDASCRTAGTNKGPNNSGSFLIRSASPGSRQSGLNRREPLQIGVGKELGGGKSIHEILVDIEFQVGNPVADRIDFRNQRGVEQKPGGPLQ